MFAFPMYEMYISTMLYDIIKIAIPLQLYIRYIYTPYAVSALGLKPSPEPWCVLACCGTA